MITKMWLYDQIPDKNKKPISEYRFYSLPNQTHVYTINRWDRTNPDYIFYNRQCVELKTFLSHYCLQKGDRYFAHGFGLLNFGGVVSFFTENGKMGLPPEPVTNEGEYVSISAFPAPIDRQGSPSIFGKHNLVLSNGDVKCSYYTGMWHVIKLRPLSHPQKCLAGYGIYKISKEDMVVLNKILDIDYEENGTTYYKKAMI